MGYRGPLAFQCMALIFIGALSLGFASKAQASVVVAVHEEAATIDVSLDAKRPWHVGDAFCVLRGKKKITCGAIIELRENFAIASVETDDAPRTKAVRGKQGDTYLELSFNNFPVRVGDRARPKRLVATKSVRRGQEDFEPEKISSSRVPLSDEDFSKLSPVPVAPEEWSDHVQGLFEPDGMDRDLSFIGGRGKEDLYLETAGRHGGEAWPLSDLTAGLNYIFPNIHYQQALTHHFATGVMPMYLGTPVGNGSLTAFGGYLTLSYYSEAPFQGSMAQIALGFFSATSHLTSASISYLTPAVMGTVGWRWRFDSGLNFGFGVGAQYLSSVQGASPQLGFSGILPCIALDVGLAF